MGIEEITASVVVDWDDFHVEKIVNHVELRSDSKKWRFRVRWQGGYCCEPEDTWLEQSDAKDLITFDHQSKERPELTLG